MSSNPDRGSALIEAVVIAGVLFIIVSAAVMAAIRVTVIGTEATEAARAATVHAARHDDVAAALQVSRALFPEFSVEATRVGDTIRVVAGGVVEVPHPAGALGVRVFGSAEMPLAPFRSDRG